MRPAQRKHLSRSTVPNRRHIADLTTIVKPLVYGCELPPKAKLAHKYLRILKRLIAGEKVASKVKGAWQWMKAGKWGGKVKNALLTGLRALGYIVNIGGQWCITSNGMQAAQA